MVSGRPLLYLSLPGVAFILGVFWFRQRNKNRLNDTKRTNSMGKDTPIADNKKETKEELVTKTAANSIIKINNAAPTKSININGKLPNEEENRVFGKSTPIMIVQNGRGGSPIKLSHSQVDSEVLKSKIQNAEHKLLRSIDEDFENLSSSVDLPDSVNNRMSFYSRNVDIEKEKPVVIIATTTPKISPENSFLENKYTKECEQNNNLDDIKSSVNNKSESQASKSPTTTTVNTVKPVVIVKDNTAPVADVNKSNIVKKNETPLTNINEERNVDASSPSLSLCSVQSGDSGKGSSLPRSEGPRGKTTYEFFLPNSLVGQLYGHMRSHVNFIKTKTKASIEVREKVCNGKLRVCAVEGTESEIQDALALIRQRFPARRYPNLTMKKIHFALPQSVVPLPTESLLNLQLNLIEGINNDVIVSAVITGGHIFVQHPLHPTHPYLVVLQKCLYESYTKQEAPLLPGIELNAVCVMPVNGVWYRVQIVAQDPEETDRCTVKFLDFGGYMNVHFNELRQIRVDFMSVPFQATECILSNIEPIDTYWSAKSADILSHITQGMVLQAQVAGYNPQNIPEIYLYASLSSKNVIFINKELEARKLAKWVDMDECLFPMEIQIEEEKATEAAVSNDNCHNSSQTETTSN